MRIVMACDHTAEALKAEIKAYVSQMGHEIMDVTEAAAQGDDYPVAAEKAARLVAGERCDCGLLFCGTGMGMMLAANKVRGVRCAVCTDPYSALMARRHNNANMLALGARVLGVELAKMLTEVFLSASFDGGRHEARVRLIADIERRSAEAGDAL